MNAPEQQSKPTRADRVVSDLSRQIASMSAELAMTRAVLDEVSEENADLRTRLEVVEGVPDGTS